MTDHIQARLDELARDTTLELAGSWGRRAEALDWFDRVWPMLASGESEIVARAQALHERLERADAALHRRLRAVIRAGHGRALFRRWQKTSVDVADGQDYDALDELVAGVLQLVDPGAGSRPLEAEMVFYQPTPARHVLDMVSRSGLGADDVLVDLGSGLGHVPMLASLCSGSRAVGVEWQPSHVEAARDATRALGLDRVEFAVQDAREADLSVGTVFFLYTPFVGTVLRQVLDALRAEGLRRPIRVCTFGPCTGIVAGETWLRTDGITGADRVAVFRSAGRASD